MLTRAKGPCYYVSSAVRSIQLKAGYSTLATCATHGARVCVCVCVCVCERERERVSRGVCVCECVCECVCVCV